MKFLLINKKILFCLRTNRNYKALPFLSETSLVNLGLTSGLIGQALRLDNTQINSVPATCQAAFSFHLKLHQNDSQEHLHNKGQVEIDAIFVGERAGEPVLFVIEAKSDPTHKSIAKHKLVYPIMAIAERVPTSVQIIPVYIKILEMKDCWHFHIVECEFPDPRTGVRAVDELKPIAHSYLKVPHISFNNAFDQLKVRFY